MSGKPPSTGRPMRILCYAAVDGTHAGGVQQVVGSLADSLENAGHEVLTVWSEPAENADEGLHVCPLHARTTPYAPHVPARRSHLPSIWRAMRLLARFRPDLVNVHFATRAAHNFLVLRRLFGYRLVLSLHGSDIMKPEPPDAGYLPALLRGADRVTAVSGALRAQAMRLPGSRNVPIHVVPNGIDTRFWRPDGRPSLAKKMPRLVAVGRLEPVKGYDVLLKAVQRLHRRGLPVALALIGAGSQEEALRQQSIDLGLAEAVEFTGALPPEGILEHLRRSDIYVLSSHSEGMPLALMEAMACGLPSVATRVGGIAEFAAGTVPLVPPAQPEALANALEHLLVNPDRAAELGAAAAQTMRERSVEHTNDTYGRLFRDMMG